LLLLGSPVRPCGTFTFLLLLVLYHPRKSKYQIMEYCNKQDVVWYTFGDIFMISRRYDVH
jgi:hypothetical protein